MSSNFSALWRSPTAVPSITRETTNQIDDKTEEPSDSWTAILTDSETSGKLRLGPISSLDPDNVPKRVIDGEWQILGDIGLDLESHKYRNYIQDDLFLLLRRARPGRSGEVIELMQSLAAFEETVEEGGHCDPEAVRLACERGKNMFTTLWPINGPETFMSALGSGLLDATRMYLCSPTIELDTLEHLLDVASDSRWKTITIDSFHPTRDYPASRGILRSALGAPVLEHSEDDFEDLDE